MSTYICTHVSGDMCGSPANSSLSLSTIGWVVLASLPSSASSSYSFVTQKYYSERERVETNKCADESMHNSFGGTLTYQPGCMGTSGQSSEKFCNFCTAAYEFRARRWKLQAHAQPHIYYIWVCTPYITVSAQVLKFYLTLPEKL